MGVDSFGLGEWRVQTNAVVQSSVLPYFGSDALVLMGGLHLIEGNSRDENYNIFHLITVFFNEMLH